jgi:hypothetical protein
VGDDARGDGVLGGAGVAGQRERKRGGGEVCPRHGRGVTGDVPGRRVLVVGDEDLVPLAEEAGVAEVLENSGDSEGAVGNEGKGVPVAAQEVRESEPGGVHGVVVVLDEEADGVVLKALAPHRLRGQDARGRAAERAVVEVVRAGVVAPVAGEGRWRRRGMESVMARSGVRTCGGVEYGSVTQQPQQDQGEEHTAGQRARARGLRRHEKSACSWP